jgi:hypothetical protein
MSEYLDGVVGGNRCNMDMLVGMVFFVGGVLWYLASGVNIAGGEDDVGS